MSKPSGALAYGTWRPFKRAMFSAVLSADWSGNPLEDIQNFVTIALALQPHLRAAAI